jgi:molecular chaperone DnaK (HSP70)
MSSRCNFHVNTFADPYRRLIGRRFDDDTVKKDIESWPFKVVDKEGNPFVQVQYLGETKTFSPQEISAMILTKVRDHGQLTSTTNNPIDEGSCRDQACQEG